MLMKQVCSGELYLINKIANAWKDMTRCSIINCFYKAGFKVDTLLSTDFQVDNSTDDTELTAMWEKIKKTENGYDFSYFEYVNTVRSRLLITVIIHPTRLFITNSVGREHRNT